MDNGNQNLRAFLAIPLNGKDIEEIRSNLHQYPCLRVTRETNVHMTLIFFKDLNTAGLEAIKERMKNFRVQSPVKMKLTGPECFPSGRKCRIIVMRDLLQDSTRLYEQVENEIIKNPEDRGFLPHVTVARVKGTCDFQPQVNVIERTAEFLTLFKSVLGPEGPVYSRLAEVQLM